jgi:hypothetical protein
MQITVTFKYSNRRAVTWVFTYTNRTYDPPPRCAHIHCLYTARSASVDGCQRVQSFSAWRNSMSHLCLYALRCQQPFARLLLYCYLSEELEFFLRPTVSRPVHLGIGPLFVTLDQILAWSSFFAWQLLFFFFRRRLLWWENGSVVYGAVTH